MGRQGTALHLMGRRRAGSCLARETGAGLVAGQAGPLARYMGDGLLPASIIEAIDKRRRPFL
jgi:hypothetical protein